MPDSGLTPTGLVIETLDDIFTGITADVQSRWGASVDNSSATPNGQFSGAVAERLASIWQLMQTVYSSQDPDKATGQALDAICKLTGTFRLPATSSVVIETLCGDPSTVVAAGYSVGTVSTGESFVTAIDATTSALPAWTISTGYTVGDRVTANARCYQCITAGTSSGSGGGPATTATDITDGTVHWEYIGEGTAAVDVPMTSVNTGPVIANSRDLTDIKTPIGGIDSALNLLDATLGSVKMSDQNLRLLREEELAKPGSTPADAIRASLLGIDGVTSVTVFQNRDDVTDGDGIPPHSVECLVQGGDDQTIFDTLWKACVAAGINSHGNTTGTSVDSEGISQAVAFTRPTLILISIDITLLKDVEHYIGDSNVQSLIANGGNLRPAGRDAVSSSLGALAFGDPGTLDVTQTLISISPATPTLSTTIPISLRQLAVYDTSRITVHSSNAVP